MAGAGQDSGAGQYDEVTPGGRLGCRLQQIKAVAAPDRMLGQFQQPGQRGGSQARADTGEQHGQPEVGSAAPSQDWRDHAGGCGMVRPPVVAIVAMEIHRVGARCHSQAHDRP